MEPTVCFSDSVSVVSSSLRLLISASRSSTAPSSSGMMEGRVCFELGSSGSDPKSW